jgi:hypothetical protein
MHCTRADGVHVHGTTVKERKVHCTGVDGVHVHGAIVKGVKCAWYQSGWCTYA